MTDKTPKPYTVVILYPPRLWSEVVHVGPPIPYTYVAHVHARNISKAKAIAQQEAQFSQQNEHRGKRIEWRPILVFEGHATPVDYC